jgi:starvation-inducible DNA-binding protein
MGAAKTAKRSILKDEDRDTTVAALQSNLADLIDLSLQGKQAHWNLAGPHFRSVHLELDEIIATARLGSDEVAERIATLGASPDGRVGQIESESRLDPYPGGFQSVEATVTAYSDRLAKTIEGLRASIDALGEVDPVSQDLLISTSAEFEKQLWMLQSQEV